MANTLGGNKQVGMGPAQLGMRPAEQEATFHHGGPMKRALALALTLALTGCGLLTEPEDELAEARARWDKAGLVSYSFQYSLYCFCGAPANLPLIIEVVNGEIAGAWNLNDFEPLEPSLLASLHTVPELFEIAERALREADDHRLSYHELYGYPTTMVLDWLGNAIDDEQTYLSSCLREASTEQALTPVICSALPQ